MKEDLVVGGGGARRIDVKRRGRSMLLVTCRSLGQFNVTIYSRHSQLHRRVFELARTLLEAYAGTPPLAIVELFPDPQ